MFKKSKIALALILFSTLIANANATSKLSPTYIPGGALSNITVFDAYDPMPATSYQGWWYLVGLLNDQNNAPHSTQLTIVRISLANDQLFATGSLAFSFKNPSGQSLYLYNTYPDMNCLFHLPVGQLNAIPAIQNNFQVGVQSKPDEKNNPFVFSFAHDPSDITHHVGQIGAHYILTANGFGEVGADQNQLQLVQYQFHADVVDQRGMVPEGDGGYVGPGMFPSNTSEKDAPASWEITAPNLQIQQWKISISPVGQTTAQSPVQKTLSFQNGNTPDRIWLDRQMLVKPNPSSSNGLYQTLIEQKLNHENPSSEMNAQFKPLYRGTWMSFCLDKAPFKNICGVASAFWNQNIATADMDSDTTAFGGFMNIYTPDSNGTGSPLQVGSTETEMLTIQNQSSDLPFRIKNDPANVYESPLSHHLYAGTTYVTIRKNTLFSALLSHFAHEKKNKTYVLRFDAVSKQTENVMVDYNAAFYEGAATVSLCDRDNHCQPVGTGFMEQMGY